MTRAPEALLSPRRLLLEYLDDSPGTDDLEPAEVGIVGDSAHRGGYHCGSDRVVPGDYSVVESSRDRDGLTLDASALDVGLFSVTVDGRTHNLRTFSVWCVAQCAANTPDSRDIREIIYSPDGRTVKRWDRLRRRSSGDSSHLWHTHFSFFRDAIKAGRDQSPLFRRYLTEIGLINVALTSSELALLEDIREGVHAMRSMDLNPDSKGRLNAFAFWIRSLANQHDPYLRQKFPDWSPVPTPGLAQLAALLSASGTVDVNESEIVAGVLAGLTPEKIAAAIPPAQTQAVADELARRLSGQ